MGNSIGDSVDDCAGIRPDGTFYGAFDDQTSAGSSVDFPNNNVRYFDAFFFKFGCARLMNGVYLPANCTVKAQGIAQTGVVA